MRSDITFDVGASKSSEGPGPQTSSCANACNSQEGYAEFSARGSPRHGGPDHVLDPPRAGAEEQAKQLAASAVPCIAYVSCNPASFARDAKQLVAGGYRLDWVQPVGQFRWSTHVELAARFSR